MGFDTFDRILTHDQHLVFVGSLYRLGTGLVNLTTSGQYAAICFTIPLGDTAVYRFATIDKTGDELLITLVEDCTYSGRDIIVPWNINRRFRSKQPLIVNARSGISVGVNPIVVTGGLEAPPRLLPGGAQGASKPGGGAESAGYIPLNPGSTYALKITALGSDTKLTAIAEIGCSFEGGD